MTSLDPDSPHDAPDVPRTPGRLRLRGGRICIGLFGVGLIVTAVAWLLPFRTDYDAGVYDVFATVAFFARVFLLPVAVGWLALGAAAAVCRRRGVAVASGVLAVAWAAPEVWMAWPRATPTAGPTFSVASFNLNKDLKDATWAIEVVRKTNADFVVMQEVSPLIGRQILDAVADLYPHAAVYPDTSYNGMAVFAKTSLRVVHAPDGYERRDLDVVATALGRELTLIDVHLSPPQQTAKRRVNRWQVGRLIEQHAADARPVMLAGDYNFTAMTPQAFALRAAGYRDAQLVAGRGRTATWPTRSSGSVVPTVRIDTVYARGPLVAVNSQRGPDIGSDHLPIVTTWRWTE